MKEWQKLLIRAGGVAAGVTVALATVAITLYWWSERPKQWTEKAVTAQTNELGFQQVGEELHLTIKYALTNSTDRDYVLPSGVSATLMGKGGENGALSKIEGASWPTDLTIPARQKVEVAFVVPYKFADYNTSSAELYGKAPIPDDGKPVEPSKDLLEFVSKRLKKEFERACFIRFCEPIQDRAARPKGHSQIESDQRWATVGIVQWAQMASF